MQARDFTAIMDILSRAQAATQIAQLLERVLPASAVVCSEVYGRWGQYAETFIRRGGVIEAVPVQASAEPQLDSHARTFVRCNLTQ